MGKTVDITAGNNIIMNANIPKVGVAAIILRNNTVLLGKRIGAHGADTWSFPGGHLEFNESLIDCAIREAKEETDLNISIISDNPVAITNDFFEKDQKHYITIYMLAKHIDGEPKITEPEKCQGWEWFSWNALPSNLFLPVRNLIKQGYNPLSQT